MTDRTWHKGPPPHVGWWNASIGKNPRAWRWWGGQFWSFGAIDSDGAGVAAREAAIRNKSASPRIQWSDYYPANARVPRIDPAKDKT